MGISWLVDCFYLSLLVDFAEHNFRLFRPSPKQLESQDYIFTVREAFELFNFSMPASFPGPVVSLIFA
jgi:hypothetical protein